MSNGKTDTWYPMYPADYLKDTLDLTLEEDGFYTRALNQVYINKGRIPTNAERLQRLLRVNRVQFNRCKWILSKYFYLDGETYGNRRADAEIAKAQSRAAAARENGKNGGRPPKENKPSNNPVGFRVDPADWDEMVKFFGNSCLKCGCVFPEGDRPTKDHIVPTSWGGRDIIANLQPLCRECNASKHAQDSTDYRQAHRGRIPKNLQDKWFEVTQPVPPGFSKHNPEKSSSSSSSPSSPIGEDPPIVPQPKKAVRRKPNPKTLIADDWQPTPETLTWCADKRLPEPDYQVPMFINHFKGKGEARADWDSSFRNWMLSPYRKDRIHGQQQRNESAAERNGRRFREELGKIAAGIGASGDHEILPVLPETHAGA